MTHETIAKLANRDAKKSVDCDRCRRVVVAAAGSRSPGFTASGCWADRVDSRSGSPGRTKISVLSQRSETLVDGCSDKAEMASSRSAGLVAIGEL